MKEEYNMKTIATKKKTQSNMQDSVRQSKEADKTNSMNSAEKTNMP